MTKTVFISRDLDEDSGFASQLQAAGWQVRGLSLVTLTALPFDEIPEVDWIFFASKNAVRFFFGGGVSPDEDGLSPSREGGKSADVVPSTSPLPPRRRGAGGGVSWAALGPATARELLRYTRRVDFTGSGDPVTTAAAFRPLAQGKKVLFPAARHSQRSVPALLADDITALHLAVYDNAPLPDPPRLEETVLVFTSPMNARAYFTRHPLWIHQRVVAIGQTTAATLADLGITGVLVSEESTESALARTVLALG